ncbi:hypothetical protein TRFO_03346 [Tritrichomonas foetus]|uniref:PH domain-containing protein n=1 Tax=Tritrichomonas foetus TaxID=1144522 RepID=A0A1J4KV53_9EUKA|nr:hypothetical protein TRFO_03346 [Tritrichomonas foetus]|eukprot:OHT13582.1 hypothetical protein TRFO_03346 [Tritrichomonas foetus]
MDLATSWLGKAPQLRDIDAPSDRINLDYPPSFAKDFNLNPIHAVQNLMTSQKYQPLENPYVLSPFLFYCPNLTPIAITQFFFANRTEAHSYFYFFFSAPILDFLSLADAARILLSRIAFPENPDLFQLIINSFVDAYCNSNQYISESRDDIFKLVIAAIILSMSRRQNEIISQASFLNMITKVKSSKEFKINYYETLKSHPIPLFFTFWHYNKDPETQKSGLLRKAGGIFKKKSKKFFIIKQNELQWYKDPSMKEISGGFDINFTSTVFVPSNGKDPAHIVIKRHDNEPFGYSINKSQKKLRKNSSYNYSSNKEEETKQWVGVLNFIAFNLLLHSIISS